MRIKKQSLMYSREAGNFTIEGEGADKVGDALCVNEGIEWGEWDEEYQVASLVYSKNMWDWDVVKEMYKTAKKH